jgi:hypothetical protein
LKGTLFGMTATINGSRGVAMSIAVAGERLRLPIPWIGAGVMKPIDPAMQTRWPQFRHCHYQVSFFNAV